MYHSIVLPLLAFFILPACEEFFPSDDDSSNGEYSSETFTITVVSERYDTIEVKLDGEYKGRLVGYKSKLEFTAKASEHTIEFWGDVISFGTKEEVLISSRDFFLDDDIVITVKPL